MNWKLEGDVWLWVMLVGAVVVLGMVFMKKRMTLRMAGYAVMNLFFAAIALYLINAVGILGDLSIPLNLPNVAVIGIFGIPGVALVAALHSWVLV